MATFTKNTHHVVNNNKGSKYMSLTPMCYSRSVHKTAARQKSTWNVREEWPKDELPIYHVGRYDWLVVLWRSMNDINRPKGEFVVEGLVH